MNKGIKIAIVTVVAALATSMGMAAPADAGSTVSARNIYCC